MCISKIITCFTFFFTFQCSNVRYVEVLFTLFFLFTLQLRFELRFTFTHIKYFRSELKNIFIYIYMYIQKPFVTVGILINRPEQNFKRTQERLWDHLNKDIELVSANDMIIIKMRELHAIIGRMAMKKMSRIWIHMMKTINLCKQNICPWVYPGFFRGKFLLILLILNNNFCIINCLFGYFIAQYI